MRQETLRASDFVDGFVFVSRDPSPSLSDRSLLLVSTIFLHRGLGFRSWVSVHHSCARVLDGSFRRRLPGLSRSVLGGGDVGTGQTWL